MFILVQMWYVYIHSTCTQKMKMPTATRCTTLQHAATRCNTRQHTATHEHPVLTSSGCHLQHTSPYYNTLQHAATRCNTPQHTSTCTPEMRLPIYSEFQHSAARFRRIWAVREACLDLICPWVLGAPPLEPAIIYMYVYVCLYIHHTHICICIYIYLYIYTCLYICTCLYIYKGQIWPWVLVASFLAPTVRYMYVNIYIYKNMYRYRYI